MFKLSVPWYIFRLVKKYSLAIVYKYSNSNISIQIIEQIFKLVHKYSFILVYRYLVILNIWVHIKMFKLVDKYLSSYTNVQVRIQIFISIY